MQGSFRRLQSGRLPRGEGPCSSSPSTGSSLGCQWQCSLPNRCCRPAPPQPSWCNRKADHLASSRPPPGAYRCLQATRLTDRGFLRPQSGCTPQSLPARRRSAAQQGNPCCSSSTPWHRTSSSHNLLNLCLLVRALRLSKVTLVVVAALHGIEPA